MSEDLLPPFPDELVERGNVLEAVVWLQSLGLPSPFAEQNLIRFGRMVGAEITARELAQVGTPGYHARELY